MEAELAHCFGIQEISPVENDRRSHPLFDCGEIDIGKVIPLGGDDERFGVFHRLQRGRRELGVGNGFKLTRFLHSFGIVNRDVRAFPEHGIDQLACDRGANVVGIRLKGQTPDGNFLFP